MLTLPFGTLNITSDYSADASAVLHHGDSLAFVRTLPSNSVKLVITSPPYNIGKAYEKPTELTAYLEAQSQIIPELVRVLADNGSLCWQVGNYVDSGEVFPLDIFYYTLFKQQGLKLRNRIIWHFEHGLHASKRLSGRYETILWFTKTDDYTFNLDSVRVPSKYPGKRHYKGDKKGGLSGNPKGKNPSDLWTVLQEDWDNEIWNIPNVKSNHPEKTDHPCQFPVELVERCVLALTDEGDMVYDPFSGVGSSVIAAIKHLRRGVGSEKEADYVTLARERIEKWDAGVLKLRPLGKPIHQPTGRDKVSQRPTEWDMFDNQGEAE